MKSIINSYYFIEIDNTEICLVIDGLRGDWMFGLFVNKVCVDVRRCLKCSFMFGPIEPLDFKIEVIQTNFSRIINASIDSQPIELNNINFRKVKLHLKIKSRKELYRICDRFIQEQHFLNNKFPLETILFKDFVHLEFGKVSFKKLSIPRKNIVEIRFKRVNPLNFKIKYIASIKSQKTKEFEVKEKSYGNSISRFFINSLDLDKYIMNKKNIGKLLAYLTLIIATIYLMIYPKNSMFARVLSEFEARGRLGKLEAILELFLKFDFGTKVILAVLLLIFTYKLVKLFFFPDKVVVLTSK